MLLQAVLPAVVALPLVILWELEGEMLGVLSVLFLGTGLVCSA